MFFRKESSARLVCFIVSFLVIVSFAFNLPINVSASNGDKGSSDLQIDYHTKTEIAEYIKSHPTEDAFKLSYDVEPSTSSPYSLGKVSDSSLNGTLALLNTYRYIAGIPYNVTLNDEYVKYTQSAAVVNAANGNMTHYPTQPSGMSDEMFNDGYKGASSSNIASGFGSLGAALKSGWMSDADSSNIGRVGHRRWVLNPTMAQTGFGYAGRHSAMYSFDRTNTDAADYKRVAWPAQNTPIGYFPSGDPWTLSVGDTVDKATLTLTCVNTGQKWVFSGEADCNKSDDTGYFNINNGGYGQAGCIVFRPKGGVTVEKNYSYTVSITGTKTIEDWIWTKEGNTYHGTRGKVGEETFSINYTVDFFDIEDYSNQSLENNENNNNQQDNEITDEQKEMVRAFVERFYTRLLARNGEADGIAYWTNKLVTKENTAVQVAEGFVKSEEFVNQNNSDEEFVKRMYLTFFDREGEPDGMTYWMDKLSKGESREAVFAGFANSEEFAKLCKKFGIEQGHKDVEINHQNENKPQNPSNNTDYGPGIKVDASGVDPAKLDEYVERLYTQILGRPGEPDGMKYWRETIINGHDEGGKPYDAATAARIGFIESNEYKGKNKSTEEFITDLYHTFLNREPEPDGLTYWVDKIEKEGYTKQQVIDIGFGCSEEFKGILKSYGFKIIE